MFIDTDTTAKDVRDIVANSLRRKVNGLNSGLSALRRGQTSVATRASLKARAAEMRGIIDVYFDVYHYGQAEGFDTDLVTNANAALAAVGALYKK